MLLSELKKIIDAAYEKGDCEVLVSAGVFETFYYGIDCVTDERQPETPTGKVVVELGDVCSKDKDEWDEDEE